MLCDGHLTFVYPYLTQQILQFKLHPTSIQLQTIIDLEDMHNKPLHNYSFLRTKKNNNNNLLLFEVSSKANFSVSSLSYSKSPPTIQFIPLQQLPERQQVYPQIAQFQQTHQHKSLRQCRRKDCVDRKFEAIKKLNKSAPNVRTMGPRKVDIVLQQQIKTQQTKKARSIHSVRMFSPNNKNITERDLLKEFKELQFLRKQLKSRKHKQTKTINLGVNNSKKSLMFQDKPDNPQRSNLYLDVKARISRRYNSMFRKYADSIKQQNKRDEEFVKGFLSARGVDRKQLKHTP